VPGPLSDSDVKLLRNVVNGSRQSSTSITTAVRTPVAENVGDGVLRLRVRGGGPADALPVQIADQVLAEGWTEIHNGYPLERVFEGRPGSLSAR
jgi:hypothetical protein